MCLINAHSLVNKLSSLQSFIYSSNLTIFCCTETWLSDSIYDNEIIPTGFLIVHKDRSSRGGGVLVVIRDTILCTSISSPSDIEVVTVAVGAPVNTLLCTVYTPPASSDAYHTSLTRYLTSLCSNYKQIILVGDFNFPGVNWSSLTGQTPAYV